MSDNGVFSGTSLTKFSGNRFSIVVLSYNRPIYLATVLRGISSIPSIEIIVVDNASSDPGVRALQAEFPGASFIFLDSNYGAVGRSFGMEAASREFIITLDDDVYGITGQDLRELAFRFDSFKNLGVICFMVLEEGSGRLINWCHPRDPDLASKSEFETCEISEGAAVFRKSVLDLVGTYPLEYFISHEGPDLALRTLDRGFEIRYVPAVAVTHALAQTGRPSWRRYYFDTRNLIWLAWRLYNNRMIFGHFLLQFGAMFLYSLRDGFLIYFFKACRDGVSAISQGYIRRHPVATSTYLRWAQIRQHREPFFKKIRRRVRAHTVQI